LTPTPKYRIAAIILESREELKQKARPILRKQTCVINLSRRWFMMSSTVMRAIPAAGRSCLQVARGHRAQAGRS
jgi:hypothetical protein